jgi:hypothetical protein
LVYSKVYPGLAVDHALVAVVAVQLCCIPTPPKSEAHKLIVCSSSMYHNLRNRIYRTPSPDGVKWKIFPHISCYPRAADFESPEDAVYIGNLSESQYRQLKPHLTMSDDSDREKAFAAKLSKEKRHSKPTISNSQKKSPVPDAVNRSVGPCAAMGHFCANPTLEKNQRHHSGMCSKGMHVIGLCYSSGV